MNFLEVQEKINEAISDFEKENHALLEVDANERSLTHKLAECLQRKFSGWDVDCEYNRDGFDPKRLDLTPVHVLSDDDKGTTVYPDIIIHKRLSDENLVVIEAKKAVDNEDNYRRDREKLRAFLEQLGYKFAIFVRFWVSDMHVEWERVEV